MPAKSDGSKPATQAQLKLVRSDLKAVEQRLDKKIDDVKTELKGDIKRLAVEMVRTREEMSTKNDLKGLQQDMQRLLKIAADSAEKGKTYFDKALSHGHILQEHESKLREHDRRLTAVESE